MRRRATALLSALLAVAFRGRAAAEGPVVPAATPAEPAAAPVAAPVRIIDDLGVTVTVASAPRRVVSLSPGASEILHALGADDRIVACCSACNFPHRLAFIPHVGEFNAPSLEAIVAQRPDLILTTGGIQREIVLKLQRLSVPVLMLYPHSVEGVLRNVAILGEAVGRRRQAEAVVAAMRSRIGRAGKAFAAIPADRRPRVYFEVWSDPFMAISDRGYVGDLIRLAGGRNIATGTTEEYPRLAAEAIIAADPEVILLSHADDPARATELIGKRPGWANLAAVRNRRVYADLDMDLILRPGPRLVDGLDRLVARLHPATPERAPR